MNEIVFASSSPQESYQISKLVREKKIIKIAPRIYTANLDEKPEVIIRRNLFQILGYLYPNAVLSHRSAFEFKPTSTNQIFLTYSYNKKTKIPGVTINLIEGIAPLEGDNQFVGGLYVSSEPRRFLENLQSSRKIGPDSKSLGIPQIEEKLDDIARIKGEQALNELRDSAKIIAPQLGLEEEYEKLNKIIGAIFTTQKSHKLQSSLAIKRALGFPYDKNRIELCEILFEHLNNAVFQDLPVLNKSGSAYRNVSFFEAYFSNYIEGTIFEVSEAKQIIETGIPLINRGEDSHDVLGTYQVVSNKHSLSELPEDAEQLIALLQERHKILLSARTSKQPGVFKTTNNRAGSTHFVDYHLVKGTLLRAFDYYKILTDPFTRAAFMMFVISEIHPFMDGNGRIARVMMNAELTNKEHCKIVIPTVFRSDYLLTLKRLSHLKDPKPYIEMLSKAHLFSATLYLDDFDELYGYLDSTNAFSESEDSRLRF